MQMWVSDILVNTYLISDKLYWIAFWKIKIPKVDNYYDDLNFGLDMHKHIKSEIKIHKYIFEQKLFRLAWNNW